jgi:5-methylcytosine-specific restriction endonuclease McrA
MKKKIKRKIALRAGVVRTRNGNQWTESRYRAFITTGLRGVHNRWDPKYKAIDRLFVKEGKNPLTGNKCKLHRCEHCNGLFAKKDISADHITPVVGPEGFTTWDEFIARLFVEVDGYQGLCKQCHSIKTDAEKRARAEYKTKASATTDQLPGFEE